MEGWNNPQPSMRPKRSLLINLTAAVDPAYVNFQAAQDPHVLNARIETYMQYETVLLEQVKTRKGRLCQHALWQCQTKRIKSRPFSVDVNHYSGKEGENLIL